MRRRVTNQHGMTLAEVLVAIAIIGVGLAALAAAIPIAGYGIQEGSQLSTATFLANARLEQAKNATWTATPVADNLGVSSGDAAPQSSATTTFPDENPIAAPYTAYTRTVRVTDCGLASGCAGITDANLRQATATVTYRPLTGVGQSPATKSATVTMLIAKR
ncbi:MAG: prepilin-type N-terminal cleavage/methylation domain-containing protein [Candidatus Rokubacteria bacterium]|nr:prepilin-type N-terminal cleavage/methylation domain-containing protein [Candidatus Rokubacteria bacterium]